MQVFDATRHSYLVPLRAILQSWWNDRPADVVGLALYGSRAKNCATELSDWDVVVITTSNDPNVEEICRDLPKVYRNTPIHALCESIDHLQSESEHGGSVLSAIAEQGVSLFGTAIPFRSERAMKPNYPSAETFLCHVLGEVHGFLGYFNFVCDKGLTHHNTSTKHSANAAEYLVKGFMSVRGINYKQIHNVKSLCEQIRQYYPNDPIIERLSELDGYTTKAHIGAYQVLLNPVEPINFTNMRMKRVLILLPTLATETFAGRQISDELSMLISITESNVQEYANKLTDLGFREIVQHALDKIREYLH